MADKTITRRSGSFLLSSLFDHHPEVLSTPLESTTNFFSRFREFYENNLRFDESLGLRILEHLTTYHPNLFRKDERYPTLGLSHYGKSNGADFLEFAGYYMRGLAILVAKGRPLFQSLANLVQISYAAATGRVINSRRPVIVWQIHNPMTVEERAFLSSMYPDFRFITTVRLPEKAFDSHLVYCFEQERRKPISSLISHLQSHFQHQDIYDPCVDGDRHFAVRFEDIHARTEDVMRALAKWVGIEWHPCLLQSTVDGGSWAFPGPKARTGCDPKVAAERATKYMWYLDRLKIRYLLRKNYVAWGYEVGSSWQVCNVPILRSILFRIPFKIEVCGFWHELKQAVVEFCGSIRRLLLDYGKAHGAETHRAFTRHEKRSLDSYHVYPVLPTTKDTGD